MFKWRSSQDQEEAAPERVAPTIVYEPLLRPTVDIAPQASPFGEAQISGKTSAIVYPSTGIYGKERSPSKKAVDLIVSRLTTVLPGAFICVTPVFDGFTIIWAKNADAAFCLDFDEERGACWTRVGSADPVVENVDPQDLQTEVGVKILLSRIDPRAGV